MLTLADLVSWHQQQSEQARQLAEHLERQITELRIQAAEQRGLLAAHTAAVQELIRRSQEVPADAAHPPA